MVTKAIAERGTWGQAAGRAVRGDGGSAALPAEDAGGGTGQRRWGGSAYGAGRLRGGRGDPVGVRGWPADGRESPRLRSGRYTRLSCGITGTRAAARLVVHLRRKHGRPRLRALRRVDAPERAGTARLVRGAGATRRSRATGAGVDRHAVA